MSRKRPGPSAWAAGDLDDAAARAAAMAPPPRPTAPDPAGGRVIVSSAAAYTIGDPPNGRLIRPRQHEGWEAECWGFYDCVGELHYVAGQYGRAVSRARFYIAEYDEDGVPRESKNPEARAYSRALLGGEASAPDIVYLSAVQLFMTGQSLIVANDSTGWQSYSDADFTATPTALARARENGPSPYKVDDGNGRMVPLDNGTLTLHMWDRHPARAYRVDSSVHPALPYLRELARLDQYVQSLLLSRIALAGILQVPLNATVAVPTGDNVPQGMDPLMHVLAQVGTANIQDPGTAAAILPVLLRMPPDAQLSLLSFDPPLTQEINNLREIGLKRLSMSLDLAPESMSGFSNVKYSNAEWIQSESVQTHIMRRVNAMEAALTLGYAVPALGDKYLVKADTSDLDADPDNSESAIALYDRAELDGDGLRRYTGMRDASPPTGAELVRQLAVRAVTTNPSLFPVLAPVLGLREVIDLTPEQERALTDAGPGDSGNSPKPIPDAAPATPQDPGDTGPPDVRPPQVLPQTPTTAALTPAPGAALVPLPRGGGDALVAACDVIVAGALGAAGSRWRRARRPRHNQCRGLDTQALYLRYPIADDRPPDTAPHAYATALVADRFGGVARVAALHAADPECLHTTLTAYVAGLLVAQRPHHPDQLRPLLAGCSS